MEDAMLLFNFLNLKERRIHRKAHSEIERIIKSIEADDTRAYNIAALSLAYTGFYRDLKKELAKSGLINTHSMITRLAIQMLKEENIDLPQHSTEEWQNKLIDKSTGPDEHVKTMALMMEGHFFGLVKEEPPRFGNYLERVFGKKTLSFIDHFDDIDENALTNFRRYYTEYRETGSTGKLAWALHYLQDITAPHHAGNYAMFFSKKTDGFDTHHGFEKKARKMINNETLCRQYISDAAVIYRNIKENFSSENPGKFASFIHGESVKNITPDIKVKEQKRWEPVINRALPLAIAATAAVLSG